MLIQTDVAGRFFAFMLEREAVRLRRVAGRPWPWTEDVILQRYKFTNIRREHDLTSQLLRKEFYDPHYNAPAREILLNCALARYFGTIEFMRAIGWQNTFRSPFLKNVVRSRLDTKQRVYTGAYLISPCNHTGPKEDVVVDIFLAALWKDMLPILRSIGSPTHWQPVVERLMQVEGFGGTGFMSKEIILDTRYTGFWQAPPLDRYTWTPVGPGSMRGAGRIQGATDKSRVSPKVTLEVCRGLFAMRPPEFKDLELHDIQFQLCEFDKYERVRLGQGRPRSLYRRPA